MSGRRALRAAVRGPIPGWILVGSLAVLWQVWTANSHSIYFPTPIRILTAARKRWFDGNKFGFLSDQFFTDITPSLERLAIGLAIAWSVGIAVGVALGRTKILAELFEPILHFMRALPGPVLLPLALILAGTGTSMRVGIIAFGAVWPTLFNAYSGAREVPRGFLETGRIARLTRLAMLRRVILPSASAQIFAGIRVSTALGIILLIASELVAASDGIGFGLTQSQRSFDFLTMWTFIVALSILGYAANALLAALGRWVLHWHIARMKLVE